MFAVSEVIGIIEIDEDAETSWPFCDGSAPTTSRIRLVTRGDSDSRILTNLPRLADDLDREWAELQLQFGCQS